MHAQYISFTTKFAIIHHKFTINFSSIYELTLSASRNLILDASVVTTTCHILPTQSKLYSRFFYNYLQELRDLILDWKTNVSTLLRDTESNF